MTYRSNLSAPDLYPAFAPRVICKPRHNSLGHDVLSDSSDELEAGFLTHDEAAILYRCAKGIGSGWWIDIGSRFGWSSAHIAAADVNVVAIDPIYAVTESEERARKNIAGLDHPHVFLNHCTSSEYFSRYTLEANGPVVGACIDGDHSYPEPLNDAKNVVAHLAQRGVIVLHDVIGGSIQEAVVWLLDNGFKARIYWTPHVMAVCWRGEFTPPDHVADPQIEPKLRPQMAGFPFERCE